MPSSSPLSQFLLWMENPIVVAMLALAVIGVRVLWVKSQRSHAAPIPTRQKANQPQAPAHKKDHVLEIIDTVLIALILVFGIVRPYFLQTFFIPSGSMEPTLLQPYNPDKSIGLGTLVPGKPRGGDKLIANRFVYRFRMPQRGEIVVFEPPGEAIAGNNSEMQFRHWLENADPTQIQQVNPGFVSGKAVLLSRLKRVPSRPDDYIKRVIGVPGDRIRIVQHEGVYINGKLLPERYLHLPKDISHSAMSFPVEPEQPSPPPRLELYVNRIADPDIAGVQFEQDFGAWLQKWYMHDILYHQHIQPYIVDGEFVVPKDSIFVMGDNRSLGGSFDSRYWGVVPLNHVRARAVSTFWPLNRLKLL